MLNQKKNWEQTKKKHIKGFQKEVLEPLTKKNQHYRLNQIIASKYILVPLFILSNFLFFFVCNYFTNIILDLLGRIRSIGESDIVSNYNVLRAFEFHSERWIWYLVMLAVGLIVTIKLTYEIRVNYKSLDVGEKANARWTTREEIREQYQRIPKKIHHTGSLHREDFFPGNGGIPIAEDFKWIYIETVAGNAIIIGMTRSGKGVYFVVKEIELLSRAEGQPSMVITDPKLELATMSYQTLVDRGYAVYVLNFINMAESVGFNPLQVILDAYVKGDVAGAEQLCRTLAQTIYHPDNERSGDSYWIKSAMAVLSACILAHIEDCVALDEEEYNTASKKYTEGRALYDSMTKKEKKTAHVFAELRDLYHEELTVKDVEKFLKKKRVSCDDTTATKYWTILKVHAMKDSKSVSEIAETLALPEETVEMLLGSRYFKCVFPEEVPPIKTHEHQKEVNLYSVIRTFQVLSKTYVSEKRTELDEYFSSRPDGNRAKMKYAVVEVAAGKTKSSVFTTVLTDLEIYTYENVAKLTAESTFDLESVGFGDKPIAVFLGIPYNDKSRHDLVTLFLNQLTYALSTRSVSEADGKMKRNVNFILDECGNIPPLDNMDNLVTLGLSAGFRFHLIIQSYAQLEKQYGDAAKTIIDNCANQVYLLTNGSESANEFSEALGKKTITTVSRSGKKFSFNKTMTESTEVVPLMYPHELKALQEGECVIMRTTHRTDLKGNPITPYPIRNMGEDKFTPYYQYLSEFFPDNVDLNSLPFPKRTEINPEERVFDIYAYLKKAKQKRFDAMPLQTTEYFKQLVGAIYEVLIRGNLVSEKEIVTYTMKQYEDLLLDAKAAGNLSKADYKSLMNPFEIFKNQFLTLEYDPNAA